MSAKLNLWDYAAAIIFLIEMGGYVYLDGEKIEEASSVPGVFIGTENKEMCENIYKKIYSYCIK